MGRQVKKQYADQLAPKLLCNSLERSCSKSFAEQTLTALPLSRLVWLARLDSSWSPERTASSPPPSKFAPREKQTSKGVPIVGACSLDDLVHGTQSETMSTASFPLDEIEFTLSSGSDDIENKSQLSSVVDGGEAALTELDMVPTKPTAWVLPSGDRLAPLAWMPAWAGEPVLTAKPVSETPPVETDDERAVAGDITRSRESFELFSKLTRSE